MVWTSLPIMPHAAFGWRIHCGVEVTELSTNKQQSLSSERGGKGDCVKKEAGGRRGAREGACIGGATTPQSSILRLILNAASLAAASPTLLFKL
jgi:hypothetical protein